LAVERSRELYRTNKILSRILNISF